MSVPEILTVAKVRQAIQEFDAIGRDAFLAKHAYGKARTFYLVENGERYDAKAIVGVALGLTPRDFRSREATTKQWLEELKFTIVRGDNADNSSNYNASELLEIGNLYTRDQLRKLFGTKDATIMTGVFRPPRSRSICLFVTEQKTRDRIPFADFLSGDILQWQGQESGRTDRFIVEHTSRNLELLLFYRTKKYEFPQAAFRYEGVFLFKSQSGEKPTSFVLHRNIPMTRRRLLKASR